jgi:hypothetical protein
MGNGNGSEGGCLCGRVRYAFPGEPVLTAVCHCRHCQKQSGSAFSIVAAVPAADFTLVGQPRVYLDSSDGGRAVERHFCADCGSPILSIIEPMPGFVLIKAGTLDDASRLKPTVEVFCDHALPCVPPIQGTEKHAGSNI